MRILSRRAVACLAAALVAVPHFAHADSAKTEAFAKAAGEAIAFQAQAARLASGVSTNTAVKAFATTVLADYSAAVTKFKQALDGTQLRQPSEELQGKLKDLLDKLKMAPTTNFDALYVEVQTALHRDMLVLFTDYAGAGDHAGLKKFATDFLLVLQDHQIRLETLSKALPRPA